MLLFLVVFFGLFAFYFDRRTQWIYIFVKTFRRDLTAAVRFGKLNLHILLWQWKNMTVPKIFSTVVKKYSHKVAFYFEDDVWTFQMIDDYSNKIANYFLAQGFTRGDRISLLLESRPEYVCFWLGLSKIGVVSALINTNLTHDSLTHCIEAAKSKAIIFGSNLSNAVEETFPKLHLLKYYQYHEDKNIKTKLLPGAVDLRLSIDNSPATPVDQHIKQTNIKDHLLYIYTSGTTGLPKAAVITHIRYIFMTLGIYFMVIVRYNDCIYNPLPLYHSAGGMVGTGQALLCGATVTLRKKFSASNFWTDCIRYNCTIAQYIGETCRYILAVNGKAPKHQIRAMFGNGLKPQIWKQFVEKFGVKEIFEFYGATEGNSNLININSTVGAVGFVPRYARLIYPVTLIKCDEITGEPIRNEKGRCIRCKVNEPGILIGKISTRKVVNQFTGYADQKATEKKILKNVFKNGDTYFNSGDILMHDVLGYYYFKDRTGDTFRWKGENVSTSEIEAVISNVLHLNDAAVYGVEIPGSEGKAGMAAIVDLEKNLDLNLLTNGLKENLPAYARPMFLRVMKSLPLTGTFKLKKRDLQQEGYDINIIKDDIYFYDSKQGKYITLNANVYKVIVSGKLRL